MRDICLQKMVHIIVSGYSEASNCFLNNVFPKLSILVSTKGYRLNDTSMLFVPEPYSIATVDHVSFSESWISGTGETERRT